MFNMINGKSVSETRSEFQEFLLIPAMAETYSEALRMGVEVFSKLGDVIKKRYGTSCPSDRDFCRICCADR